MAKRHLKRQFVTFSNKKVKVLITVTSARAKMRQSTMLSLLNSFSMNSERNGGMRQQMMKPAKQVIKIEILYLLRGLETFLKIKKPTIASR